MASPRTSQSVVRGIHQQDPFLEGIAPILGWAGQFPYLPPWIRKHFPVPRSPVRPEREGAPSEIVLLGTGVSTALPRISCVLRGRLESRSDGPGLRTSRYVPCSVCQEALANPESPNRRCNVSALVRLGDVSIMIDCGKTAREACIRQLPRLGVKTIEAVVLTHGHADAILGLDDLRDIQSVDAGTASSDGKWNPSPVPIPVHLSPGTMADVKKVFPYLVETADKDIERRVSKVAWNVFQYNVPFRPFEESQVTFTPIPLLHGGDYICAGFIISGPFARNSVVAYLSDVNEIPVETMTLLKEIQKIDVLIIDSLLRDITHSSHFCLNDAIRVASQLRPRKTLCVGMTCSVGLHDDVNSELSELLASEGLDIQLGYDGQVVSL